MYSDVGHYWSNIEQQSTINNNNNDNDRLIYYMDTINHLMSWPLAFFSCDTILINIAYWIIIIIIVVFRNAEKKLASKKRKIFRHFCFLELIPYFFFFS